MAGPELWQLLEGLGGGDPLSLLGSLGGFPGGLGSLLGGGRGPDLLGLLGRLGAGADSGPVVDVEPEPVEGGEDGGAEERAEAPPRNSAEKKGPRLDTGQLLSLLSLLGRMGVHPPGPSPSPGGYGAYAGSPPGYAGNGGESWSPSGYAEAGGESWSPPGYVENGGESWSPPPGYAGNGGENWSPPPGYAGSGGESWPFCPGDCCVRCPLACPRSGLQLPAYREVRRRAAAWQRY